MTSNRKSSEMVLRQVAARKPASGNLRAWTSAGASAFDTRNFDTLSEMIGEDGAREMVEIFETETKRRLQRLAEGVPDIAALVREMHTLKGAAGTIASPRLAELGRTLEQAARRGVVPTPNHLKAIEEALGTFLVEARARNNIRSAAA
jgi:HPt (histidine-containing phosphotransfer) domain-containing protein